MHLKGANAWWWSHGSMVGQLSGPGWNQTWYHAPGTLDVAVEVPETAFSSALEHPAGGVGDGCFFEVSLVVRCTEVALVALR